jgi:transcription antitermination factor NusG
MDETGNPDIRFCNTCSQNVYRCKSRAELEEQSQSGHCVCLAFQPCNSANTHEGDVVQVVSGKYESFDAVILDIDHDEESAKIIPQLIGRIVPMWVPLDQLGHIE